MKRVRYNNTSFVNMITEAVSRYFLMEATQNSLRQMYGKYFDNDYDVIDEIVCLDKSTRKKFAEWLIRTAINQSSQEGCKPIDVFYSLTNKINKLATASNNGEFQVFSYNTIDDAYEAYNRIKRSESYDEIKPVYSDDTIDIYMPQNRQELFDLCTLKFRKIEDEFHWCVLDNTPAAEVFDKGEGTVGDEHWNEYGEYDTYNFFLIYNKIQKKLYLWNNNPNTDWGDEELCCYQFNDWGNNTCHPINDACLTQGAINFLNTHSSEECSFDDVITYIDENGF